MASPSISEICRPESFALSNTSNNCWMMKRLCSSSTAFTNRENPLMSGIKSKPLFSMAVVLTCATHPLCMSKGCLPCHQRYTIAFFPCHRRSWETHGPPRVKAPHTAIPCVDRVCGCCSVTRSVKTEPEQYQWVAIVLRQPVASVLARVVQAEPAWVRGQTILALGCGSGVAGIGAHDIDLVALAIAAQ